jgi:hypothetical protein
MPKTIKKGALHNFNFISVADPGCLSRIRIRPFFNIPDPGFGPSFIPDPGPTNKRREKLDYLFSCMKRSKLKSYFKQIEFFPFFAIFKG